MCIFANAYERYVSVCKKSIAILSLSIKIGKILKEVRAFCFRLCVYAIEAYQQA